MIGPGPLDGVRVLDLGGEMGGYGTRLLGELGADVLKVEPPAGDRQRRRPPLRAGVEGPEASLVFAYYQAGKRGTTLDAGRPDAVPLLTELAAACVSGGRPRGSASISPRYYGTGWVRTSRRSPATISRSTTTAPSAQPASTR
jgi:hypothetical protein